MFDTIKASAEISGSLRDYLSTTFDISDEAYRNAFREALEKTGTVSRGPYLDISGSYKQGKTLSQLIDEGAACPLFNKLEPVAEEEREIKLQRPLYSHQEAALRKAKAGGSLVVTTGTGSGKTECFLIPVLNHLLEEIDKNTLTDSVRAMVIYPMNALANDQIKRMRDILSRFPAIRFGLYNGDTEYKPEKARNNYKELYHCEPPENEVISREEMQDRPPHILITNYSMLEYMMLRPKDDAVFSGARLRYIILDEAHIYKGATGIETSLLMRRLRARIEAPENVRFILTSATLGGKDADERIVEFAEKLCGTPFSPENIVRSEEILPQMKGMSEFPPEMYSELEDPANDAGEVLEKYGADFAPGQEISEKLYELCLNDKMYMLLRSNAVGPIAFDELHSRINAVSQITPGQLRDFISVCSKASYGNTSLMKVRYHLFVRALEGAYITANEPKQLFLSRRHQTDEETPREVFEAAVCTDCGRLAVAGSFSGSGKPLEQCAVSHDDNDSRSDYFMLCDKNDEHLFSEDDVPDTEDDEISSDEDMGEYDYLLCPECGIVTGSMDYKLGGKPCSCRSDYIRVIRAAKTKSGKCRCPACGFGSFRRFYVGADAATAVIGTELYEQLPAKSYTRKSRQKPEETAEASSFFGPDVSEDNTLEEKDERRQFICFSDSRSEAAYFADYMGNSYEMFLRRRGIWHVAQKLRERGISSMTCTDFADELTRYFIDNKAFLDDKGKVSGHGCKGNSWVAILDEMYNARRKTSLVSMGVLSFEFMDNDEWHDIFTRQCHIPPEDSRALLELLVSDAVFSGAVDAGKEYPLDFEQREYIFYSANQKNMVKSKQGSSKKSSASWQPHARPNGSYYYNSRVNRLVRELGISEKDADKFLGDYWDRVFLKKNYSKDGKVVLPAGAFRVYTDTSEKGVFVCRKCGRTTPFNVGGHCAMLKCDGQLRRTSMEELTRDNRYAHLYSVQQMAPLSIKEHTAQLSKEKQSLYQQGFINGKLNALSCSTTFELGVDLGSLETVYMRDVPPSPSNYVQRAGRAGRGKGSAAFVLTYAKLSSHDLTYYSAPETIISGRIQAPVFDLKNEKIINRHIFAVALSAFFSDHPEVYDGDNLSELVNNDGFEKLVEWLDMEPAYLRAILERSIPEELHSQLGISDFSWTERFTGENGILRMAVEDFRKTVEALKNELKKAKKSDDFRDAARISDRLRSFRCAPEDKIKKSLIDFLVRSNVLPKYGFPVDTVELHTNNTDLRSKEELRLSRDLQMAVAEYAPGSQVIADGHMYTSRYILKNPGEKNKNDWEIGYYCEACPNCKEPNFTKNETEIKGWQCIHCGKAIPQKAWLHTIEPRRGFVAEQGCKPVPMRRPERDYKTDASYIGDRRGTRIKQMAFMVNDMELDLESTTNDSLVVVGRNRYKVCPVCGYADEKNVEKEHYTPFGYKCSNKDGKSDALHYRLSHDFKTDAAKIIFRAPEAADKTVMLSVLYALLEGLSRELGIERTDIGGCLHRVTDKGILRYSVVLYDTVAGGAGHVRRLVTDDGSAFRAVISRAISLTESCDCDSSCYQCLRNYYNQKIHDQLDRKKACDFLRMWQGELTQVERDEATDVDIDGENASDIASQGGIVLNNDGNEIDLSDNNYEDIWIELLNWADTDKEKEILKELCDNSGLFEGLEKPVKNCGFKAGGNDEGFIADLAWRRARVMYFSVDDESYRAALSGGWKCFCSEAEEFSVQDILDALKEK